MLSWRGRYDLRANGGRGMPFNPRRAVNLAPRLQCCGLLTWRFVSQVRLTASRSASGPAMTERGSNGPLVRLAGVYENTSQRGTRYFVGYMGAAKLVMLPAKDAKEGEPQWTLFVQERPARTDGTGASGATWPTTRG